MQRAGLSLADTAGLWLSWGTSHRFKTTPLITEQAEPHVRSKETEYKENSKVQA